MKGIEGKRKVRNGREAMGRGEECKGKGEMRKKIVPSWKGCEQQGKGNVLKEGKEVKVRT